MKFAFCLFHYFPHGGLQRDFLHIAEVCAKRGHDIHVFTMNWQGEKPPHFQIHLVPIRAWQNHTRAQKFSQALPPLLKELNADLVIGFNKMPHLDIYYAADTCYQARIKNERSWLYRLLPRYRQWARLEQDVFAHHLSIQILLIAARQQSEYSHTYNTDDSRFHLLPPGISKDRLAPLNANQIRNRLRASYQLSSQDKCLLFIGSRFKTKGLDRALIALSSLPTAQQMHSHLFVIGEDNDPTFRQLAKQLAIETRVHFLGGRFDVPDFLLAADLLIHPARLENTGTVLLEALAAGLPVLTVDACGYAPYVKDACAGRVLASPFVQSEFNQALYDMLVSSKLDHWQKNAVNFIKHNDIFSMPEKAADYIEQLAGGK